MSIQSIIDDFALLDDWEDRYRYVIELGRALPELPEAERNEATKVRGCASQVWLVSDSEARDGKTVLLFRGDSDAHIVRGLIAIVLALYSEHSPQEILGIDAEAIFQKIGLREHLTSQRSNGLSAMLARIRSDAEARLAA
ncbi:SufE family protein [Afifella sp. IM 167]|uniref:SufE family protein n=1 Tax=Afifella sp. IM 167 TaxID=2033586 RepID=UPI001CCC42E2|nr:SufE family protein [Afifella sp. IM 167]MBZ8133101.1 cysteine desulfuration protein SufE [Afifella sp. IM 167]